MFEPKLINIFKAYRNTNEPILAVNQITQSALQLQCDQVIGLLTFSDVRSLKFGDYSQNRPITINVAPAFT